MRKFITGSLELLCQIGIVLILLLSIMSGASQNGVTGAIVGLIGGVIFSVVLFGGLFLLMDIADNTRKTAELLQQRSP